MEDEILEYLLDNDKSDFIEISPILTHLFPHPSPDILSSVRSTLHMFISKQFILRKDDGYGNLGYGGGPDDDPYSWKRENAKYTIPLLFRIAIEGRNYIENKRRLQRQDELLERQTVSTEMSSEQNVLVGQSVIDTNTISIRNFTTQKNFNIITIAVGALTLVTLVVYTYYTSKTITEKSFLKLDSTIQNSTKRLDSMLIVQKGIDSSLRIMAGKDSLKKK